MSNELLNTYGDDIVKADPSTARGRRVHLGVHKAVVTAAKFFRSKRDQALVCVVEMLVEETLQRGCFDGLPTEHELAAGKKPHDLDEPHAPNDRVSAVWAKKGNAALMFDNNVAGFVLAAKVSAVNQLIAIRKLSDAGKSKHSNALAGAQAFFAEMGLVLPTDKAPTGIEKADALAVLGDAQAAAGLQVKLVSTRVETVKNKNRVNIVTFDGLSIGEWEAILAPVLAQEPEEDGAP